MEQLRGELGAYGDGLQGHVRLLCNTSAMTEHLPTPLGRFLSDNPRISVDLEERASEDIVDALRAGLCDIGIVSNAVDTAGLEPGLQARRPGAGDAERPCAGRPPPRAPGE